MTRLNAYLSFKDNARQAMEFYKSVFGGKLEVSTFQDYGMSQNPADADKVMHSMLEAGTGVTFMAADTPDGMEYSPGKNLSLALSGDDSGELTGYFGKLSSGGKVEQPLEKAPWGDAFGMLIDKFGVRWMVNIGAPKP